MNPSLPSNVRMKVQAEGSSSRIRMRISPAAWKSARPALGETRAAWRFTSAGGGGGGRGGGAPGGGGGGGGKRTHHAPPPQETRPRGRPAAPRGGKPAPHDRPL